MASGWLKENDVMSESSLTMATGICPMSVFDKFGWDDEFYEMDDNELLDDGCIKTEPEDDPLSVGNNITDFDLLAPIFPDLIEETTRNEPNRDFDELKPLLSLPTSSALSSFSMSGTLPQNRLSSKKDVTSNIKSLANGLDSNGKRTFIDSIVKSTELPAVAMTRTDVKNVNNDTLRMAMTSAVNTAVTMTTARSGINSIIRLPLKRNAANSIGSATTGSKFKAVVVCPDRSKSIICNVVRSSNKGIVIQKPVNRSLLNVCSNFRNESSKLPIKVNIISSKKSGSDEEFHPFSSSSNDCNNGLKCDDGNFQDGSTGPFLFDDDNLCSDKYKCFPPAEVTGQIQPVIPDVFKYTPNSSPTNDEDPLLDSFYPKLNVNSHNQFYNKAAANVDHDYGFTCRAPKFSSSIASIFNVDNLGIQTPSASEPPTDSDDNDDEEDDITLLNKDFDCSELDREQSEYFENLKHQLKLAELVCKGSEKDHSLSKSTNIKESKQNRKCKTARDNSTSSAFKNAVSLGESKYSNVKQIENDSVPSINGKTLKMRLPVRDNSAKKRKTCSGGRIFSPSERHLHNTNEQVRRIEMRQSFEELRHLIPNLLDKPRAPKVSILQEAKTYCDELFHNDLKLQAQITVLKCQQERLRYSLSRLRRHVAASRH